MFDNRRLVRKRIVDRAVLQTPAAAAGHRSYPKGEGFASADSAICRCSIVSLKCGFSQNWPRLPLVKLGAPWPLGRVDIRLSELVVNGVGPLWRPVHLRYGDVAEGIVCRFIRSGGSVRVSMGSGRGDIRIATLGDGYLQIVDVLRRHGIVVRDEDPPTSMIIRRSRS